MRHFYIAPTALARDEVTRPHASHTAYGSPDDPNTVLVVVEGWGDDVDAQDEWEARAGVVSLPLWQWHLPAPAQLRAAFASQGVKPTHSTGEAMTALRAIHRRARP